MTGDGKVKWTHRAGIVLSVVLATAFLCRALTAQAGSGTEDKKEKAKKHFNRAIQFFDKGKYEDALIDFEVSYDYRPHWKIKYNMALCHFHLGHYIAAADLLKAFLREGGPKVSAEEAKQAGEVFAIIEKKVGTLTLTGEVKGTLVKIDGKKVENLKESETVFLEPGKHAVYVASSDSVLVDETIDFEPGESKEILIKVLVVKTGPTAEGEGGGEGKTVKAEIKGKAPEVKSKAKETETEAEAKAKKAKAEEKALKAEAKEKAKKAKAEEKARKAEAKENAKKAKAEEKALKAEAKAEKTPTRKGAPLDPLTVSAWAMVGVGSAALLSAVVVGGLAGRQRTLMKDAEDEYMAAYEEVPLVPQEELDGIRKDRNDHYDKGMTLLYAMAGLLAVGSALGAASVTLLVLPREKKEKKADLSLPQLSLGPGGALITFSFQ